MSAKIFNRYVWLLDLIASHDGISYKKISNAWEKSSLNDRPGEPLAKRTFNNHIQAISEAFGIDIVCRRQGGYKYVIETTDDGAISKTKDMLLNYLLASNIQLKQIESPYMIMPEINLRGHISSIDPAFEAITSHRKIKILWGWVDGDVCMEDRWVELEPYYIKGYNGLFSKDGVQWHLYGKGGNKGALQVYKLDNIKEVVVLNETFCRPADSIEEIEYKTFHQPCSQTDDDDSFGACVYWADKTERYDYSIED